MRIEFITEHGGEGFDPHHIVLNYCLFHLFIRSHLSTLSICQVGQPLNACESEEGNDDQVEYGEDCQSSPGNDCLRLSEKLLYGEDGA